MRTIDAVQKFCTEVVYTNNNTILIKHTKKPLMKERHQNTTNDNESEK